MTKEDLDKYNGTIRAIRQSRFLFSYEKTVLYDYINAVKENKRNNDFFDWEFLSAIMTEIANGEININRELESVDEALKRIIKEVKSLLPAGLQTDNYEVIKNIIIVGSFDIDIELYNLFDNKLYYQQILNIINGKKDYVSLIKKYIVAVSPYCMSDVLLKREIISFCNGLDDYYGEKEDYFKERLEEAKKRVGIYPVDEKTLSQISYEAKKLSESQEKLDDSLKRADEFKDKVSNAERQLSETTKLRIKDIDAAAASASRRLEKSLDSVREELTKQLDEYIVILEGQLKKSSDEAFNAVLREASIKLNSIKVMADTLGMNTTQDLVRLQKATEESISKLKKYVDDDPQLQKAIQEATKTEKFKDALLAYEETAGKVQSSSNAVVLQGYDRIIVPQAPNVIIPKGEISRKLLRAFDESIPFDVRLKEILKEKERREKNGEIFHDLTEQVLICLMEGDWPYLYGPSGCGKSYLIQQAADLLGIDLVESGKITEKESIMGYNDVSGRYRASQTFVAARYGKLLSLDEFDNSVTEHQVVLNPINSALLDTIANPSKEKYITFGEDMPVAIHPNFRMISAGNTDGSGANDQYSDRGKIDESVQQRQIPIKYYYDNKVEQKIFGANVAWYNLFTSFRDACKQYARMEDGSETPPGMITTRDASAIVRYIGHNSKSIDSIIDEKFTQTKDINYLKAIRDYIKQEYEIDSDEEKPLQIKQKLEKVDEETLARCLVHGCTRRINQYGEYYG